MKTSEYDGPPFAEARSHPWTDGVASPEHRYYDFKAEPFRIRTSLEDFVPWAHYPAVEELYALLEWLNAPACVLESNDCAFAGPHASEAASSPEPLQCSGRVMVLYRELERNLARGELASLAFALHRELGPLNPEFGPGMVGTTIVPVRYVTLRVPDEAQLGHQLMISFWARGRSEREVMANLCRVLKNLSRGLRPLGESRTARRVAEIASSR